ncbi:hypothetical protein HYH03_005681 [Edaphochlamys debaryana]|uniref:Protein kinase domain-containing protein n=1 Tax=Edaphochlamys debaryana TaxID=47281 RepID=A0A835Y5N5_9CHLO|nr:hypothetical protein HYH03_005681 [Edaphochlamys debaryana]|eukprot:KAG2496458.1 hypothetical protein HYH03_005681 [Edaphochlamys debaryana]
MLGPQLVGAMLLALPGSSNSRPSHAQGRPSASGPDRRPVSPRQVPVDVGTAAGAQPFAEALCTEPGALEALGACVAECCLGPVLPAVEQACGSAEMAACSPSLRHLACSLGLALASSLATDLHVDLAVRIALLPSADALAGVLFEEASAVPGPRLHASASSAHLASSQQSAGGGAGRILDGVTLSAAAAGALAAAGAAGGAVPPGLATGAGGAGRSAGGAGANSILALTGRVPSASSGQGRVALLQAAAAARAAAGNPAGPVSADDSSSPHVGGPPAPPPALQPSLSGPIPGSPAGARAAGYAAATGGSGGLLASQPSIRPPAGGATGRGLQAPQSPIMRGPGKALALPLSSTLAASLLRAAQAPVHARSNPASDLLPLSPGRHGMPPVVVWPSGGNAGGIVGGGGFGTGLGMGMGIAASLGVRVGASTVGGSGGSRAASGGGTLYGRAAPPLQLRLAAAVVSDVPGYLHDSDQPSADVFTIMRRAGGAGGSASASASAAVAAASLVALAGCWTGPGGSSSDRAGSLGFPGGFRTSDATRRPVLRNTLTQPLPGTQPLASGAHGSQGGTGTGGTGSTAVQSASLLLVDAAGAGVPGSGGGACPAFVFYLTSALPLPAALLAAARDRALGLTEILLPSACYSLTHGPVAEEWGYMTALLASGGAMGGTGTGMGPGGTGVGLGSMIGLPSGPAVVGLGLPSMSGEAGQAQAGSGVRSRRNTATGLTASGAPTANDLRSGGSPRVLRLLPGGGRSGGLAATSPPPTPATGDAARRDEYSLTSSSAAPAAAAPIPPPSGAGGAIGSATQRLVNTARAVLASTSASGIGALLSARASLPDQHASPPPPAGPGSARVVGLTSGGESGQGQGQGGAGGGVLDTLLSTAGLMGMGEEDAGLGHNTAILLSGMDNEAAQDARQAQLDIMVSTFHTALSRARNEAGPLGGAHAEEDVRSLRLIKTIGMGGCSVVVLGQLHAMPVAVKVIMPPEPEEHLPPQGAAAASTRTEESLAGRSNAALAALGGAGGAGVRAWARPSVELSPAARQAQLRLLMRGARELAVMTTISHPNIVQVYSYSTRVVVLLPADGGVPQLEVVPEGELPSPETEGPMCTALIMEYCDMGSLADAIDNGTFGRAARQAAATNPVKVSQSAALTRMDPAGLAQAVRARTGGVGERSNLGLLVGPGAAVIAGTPAMRAVYLTLMEVALALRHLHSMNLVHCDVKPANVLLRSSATDPRGFTAKLTDFGFVNLLEAPRGEQLQLEPSEPHDSVDSGTSGSRATIRFQEPVGTVTHMAPELFIKGSVVDSSIDCYAFGILM